MSNGSKEGSKYRVRITFDGLCPFVPGQEGSEQEWVGAFLVDAGATNRRTLEVDLPVHFPVLEYGIRDLVGMENAPDLRARSPLNLVDVAFVPPQGSEPGLAIAFAKGAIGTVPLAGERNLFDWVTPMEEVTPGSGAVVGECFEPDPSRLLAARVHMTQGLLETESLGEVPLEDEETKRDLVVRQIGAGAMFRAVAKRVSLTIPCAAGEFRLRVASFDSKSQPTELVFRQPPDQGRIEIGISNLCAGDLLPGSDLEPADPLAPDEDFRWNYLLSEGGEELLRKAAVPEFLIASTLNLLIPTISDGGGGGAKGGQCSPPRTQSTSTTTRGLMLDLATRLKT